MIRNYYRAIARQNYQQAYLDWDGEGSASKQSFEQFRQGFANTASTTVEVGKPGTPNGSAGWVYLKIPVMVNAKTTSGILRDFAVAMFYEELIMFLVQHQPSASSIFTRQILNPSLNRFLALNKGQEV